MCETECKSDAKHSDKNRYVCITELPLRLNYTVNKSIHSLKIYVTEVIWH